MTMRRALDAWLADGERVGLRPATSKRRRDVGGRMLAHFAAAGVASVGDIAPQHVRDWDATLAHLADSSRFQYLAILQQWLDWCIEQGWLASNPVKKVRKPRRKSAQSGSRAMSVDELRALVRVTAEFERHRKRYADRSRATWYLVAGLTGLRSCEMRRIRWRDIDLDHGELWLRAEITKEARPSVVPLTAEVVECLRAWHARDKPKPTDRVFDFQIAHLTFRDDLERAGITREDRHGRTLTLHGLRKTCASLHAAAGTPMQTTALLTRHRDPSLLVNVYTDLEKSGAREAVDNLPRLLGLGADVTAGDKKSGDCVVDGANAADLDCTSTPPIRTNSTDWRPPGSVETLGVVVHLNQPDRAQPVIEFSGTTRANDDWAQSLAGPGLAGNGCGFRRITGQTSSLSLPAVDSAGGVFSLLHDARRVDTSARRVSPPSVPERCAGGGTPAEPGALPGRRIEAGAGSGDRTPPARPGGDTDEQIAAALAEYLRARYGR